MLRVDVNLTFQEKNFLFTIEHDLQFTNESRSKVGINNIPGNRDPGEKE